MPYVQKDILMGEQLVSRINEETKKIQAEFVIVSKGVVTNLTLLNNWTTPSGAFETPLSIKKNGNVYLSGLVTGGTTSSVICKLVAGSRPRKSIRFVVPQASSSCVVQIDPNGDVIHMGGSTSNIFLDGVVFNIEW